jgi:predicted nucleic acid-binding protein
LIIITDSNILFSALCTPTGIVASIFKEKSNIQFLAPDYLILEIKKHIDKIVTIRVSSKKQILSEFTFLLSKITIIETENIPKKYIIDALEIVSDIDADDLFFVALNRYKKYKIWTSDKKLITGLQNKGYDICITTAQIRLKLYKKTI